LARGVLLGLVNILFMFLVGIGELRGDTSVTFRYRLVHQLSYFNVYFSYFKGKCVCMRSMQRIFLRNVGFLALHAKYAELIVSRRWPFFGENTNDKRRGQYFTAVFGVV
jgi:hypothetical protein